MKNDNDSINAVDSAEWFSDAQKWLRICFGYNNPINYASIHSELLLINQIQEKLRGLTTSNAVVFYGIGSGDTEMQVVDVLAAKYSQLEVFGVDINPHFLHLFDHSLRLRTIEQPEVGINFHGLHVHFEEFSRPEGYDNTGINFYILGSSIGNYNDSGHFFHLLNNVIRPGDKVFISFQTNRYLERVFEKYQDNELYNDLISSNRDVPLGEIEWKLDREGNKIQAFHGNTQLFRSIKNPPEHLEGLAIKHGYHVLGDFQDEVKNLAFLILEK